MDFYVEPAFFCLLVPIVVISVVLGVLEKPIGRFGCTASLIMCALMFFRTPVSAIFAAAYLALSIALYKWVVKAFAEREGDGIPIAYKAAIVLQLLPLVAYKVGVVFTPDFPGFLGISYITFKSLQVLIEVRDGLIKDMSLFEYVYFLSFFPTFTSGPILRSRVFVGDMRTTPTRDVYLERLYRGLGWFLVGALYKFVISGLAHWALWFVPEVAGSPALAWIAKAFFYGLDLFFDFAGYSAMAMGVGLVMGIEVPRNFRAPFLSIDIKDFWDRWHITLSTWLRDFVFMRFSRLCMERKVFDNRITTASVGFMVNMTLMGLWHGLTPAYIAYGVYHGALMAGFHFYQQKSKFYKAHRKEKWYKVASWALTMVFVFFGFALFAGYVF